MRLIPLDLYLLSNFGFVHWEPQTPNILEILEEFHCRRKEGSYVNLKGKEIPVPELDLCVYRFRGKQDYYFLLQSAPEDPEYDFIGRGTPQEIVNQISRKYPLLERPDNVGVILD